MLSWELHRQFGLDAFHPGPAGVGSPFPIGLIRRYIRDCPARLGVLSSAKFSRQPGDFIMVEIDAVPIFVEIGAFARWDRIMSPHETMSSPCLGLFMQL